jgi:hypothetical protein
MAEYEPKEVDISSSLLLELMDALKRYGSDVVVIGGWAPYFLLKSFSHATEEHVGSLDADLALNFRGIPEEAYETLLETIRRLGYRQRKNAAGKPIPASFEKTVTVGSVPYVMQVDFLAGEYGGNAKSHRHQRVQDMLAHKARGADMGRLIEATNARSRSDLVERGFSRQPLRVDVDIARSLEALSHAAWSVPKDNTTIGATGIVP